MSLEQSTNVTYTCTTYAECVDHDLFRQYAFELIKVEFRSLKSELFSQWQNKQVTLDEFARAHTQFMRSWSESALREALESSGERSQNDIEALLNQFWTIYEQEVKERPDEHDSQSYRTFLVLKKIKNS